MADYILSKNPNAIMFEKTVTGIAKVDGGMEVTTDDKDVHKFSHVISTLPLPVLRTFDLRKAGLSPMQTNALRDLNYGPSIKIGLQFKRAWWTLDKDKSGRPLNIIGGQTYTDRPLRTVVYPSFGDVMAGKTTTLIASYCWTEDATQLGSLIGKDDERLKALVLRELAEIHNVEVNDLYKELIDLFAWDWTHNPYTMGKPRSKCSEEAKSHPCFFSRCLCVFRAWKIRQHLHKPQQSCRRWVTPLCGGGHQCSPCVG